MGQRLAPMIGPGDVRLHMGTRRPFARLARSYQASRTFEPADADPGGAGLRPFSTGSSRATSRFLRPARWPRALGVSRNTVVLAYQGLLDDGYLVARERSGYYVSDKALDAPPRASGRSRGGAAPAGGAPAGRLGNAASPSTRPPRRTSQSRSTGRPTPIPSSTARSTTICFRSPNGATARGRRWARNGSAPGPTTPGP